MDSPQAPKPADNKPGESPPPQAKGVAKDTARPSATTPEKLEEGKLRIWYSTLTEPTRHFKDVGGNRIRLGRGPHNEIVLNSPYIPEEAAVLSQREGKWELTVLAKKNSIEINGLVIRQGQRCIISRQTVKFKIYPFTVTIEFPGSDNPAAQAAQVQAVQPAGTQTEPSGQKPAPKPAPAQKSEPQKPEPTQQPEPPAVVTAAWKELEPADPSDPVDHIVKRIAPGIQNFRLLAASIRGKLHAHKALWREDAFDFEIVENYWTIIAVADGAGTAKWARVASKIACAEAMNYARKAIGTRQLQTSGDVPSEEDQAYVRDLLAQSAHAALSGLKMEKEKRGCELRDLNTTFLLVAHAPFKDKALVGALQIGDGAIGVYTADDSCKLMTMADHGQYSSETRFLTETGMDQQFAQRVKLFFFSKEIHALAVMCDGVSDDFFPEDKRLIELFRGNPIQELKTRQGESLWGLLHKDKGIVNDPREGQALVEWLQYERRGSSDDRTLVLMYRN